jgi:uncharacterized membrane protein YfcA
MQAGRRVPLFALLLAVISPISSALDVEAEDAPSTALAVLFVAVTFLSTMVESTTGFGSAVVVWLFYQIYAFFPVDDGSLMMSTNEVIAVGQTVVGILVITQSRAWEHAHIPSVAVCGVLTLVVAPLGQMIVVWVPVPALKLCASVLLLLYFAWRFMLNIVYADEDTSWDERRVVGGGNYSGVKKSAAPAKISDDDYDDDGMADVEAIAMAILGPDEAELSSEPLEDRVKENERDLAWWRIAKEENYGPGTRKMSYYEINAERDLIRKINNRWLKEKSGKGHTKKENMLGVSEVEIGRSKAHNKLGTNEKAFQMSKALKKMGVVEEDVAEPANDESRLSTVLELPPVPTAFPTHTPTTMELMPLMVAAGIASGICGGTMGVWGPPVIIWFHHLASKGLATKSTVRCSGASIGFMNLCGRWVGSLAFASSTSVETGITVKFQLIVAGSAVVGTCLGFYIAKKLDVGKVKLWLDSVLLFCALSLGIGGITGLISGE